jgi:hypothetical protein
MRLSIDEINEIREEILDIVSGKIKKRIKDIFKKIDDGESIFFGDGGIYWRIIKTDTSIEIYKNTNNMVYNLEGNIDL